MNITGDPSRGGTSISKVTDEIRFQHLQLNHNPNAVLTNTQVGLLAKGCNSAVELSCLCFLQSQNDFVVIVVKER